MRSTLRRSAALSALLLAAALPAAAREAPVQITVGQPNIWSLEQAHYLLAQMHERSNGLKVKLPGEDAFDPQAFHAGHLELLRTALSLDVSLDETVGTKNELSMQRFQADDSRHRQLQAELDDARHRQARLAREIAELQAQRALLSTGSADETVPPVTFGPLQTIDARIAAKQAEKASVDAQVATLVDAIGDEPELPELTSSSPDTTASLPESGFAEVIAGLTLGTPKLHPSAVLDNFVQFQYEVIAKQLSLLRDELGPDERLVFLELPQAVYTVPGRAKGYLVRTAWQVTGVCESQDSRFSSLREGNPSPQSTEQLLQTCGPRLRGDTPSTDARVLDVIPRTSSLSIDDFRGKSNQVGVNASFGGLAGIGAGLALQRQRDTADRLATQQVFASGYGRGTGTFWWVFVPPPGADRINPGDKTTYAVVAVPAAATMIALRPETCYFYESQALPEPFTGKPRPALFSGSWSWCSKDLPSFKLRVPGHFSDQPYVHGIDYSGVEAGERITVFLRGTNFSPQIGVVVNGTPLRRTTSLAQETLALPAANGVSGLYEVVNSRAIVLSFSMGTDYEGTPIITLVAPGKTAPINYYRNVEINDRGPGQSLYRYSSHHPMFRQPAKVTAVHLPDAAPGVKRELTIEGTGFRNGADVTINGLSLPNVQFVSPSLLRIELDLLDRHVKDRLVLASEWRLRYADRSSQRHHEAQLAAGNPLSLAVDSVQVLAKSAPPKKGEILLLTRNFHDLCSVHPLDGVTTPATCGASNTSFVAPGTFTASLAAEEPKVLQVCGLPEWEPYHPNWRNNPTCILAAFPKATPPKPTPRIHRVLPASTLVGTNGTGSTLLGADLKPVQHVLFGKLPAKILRNSGTEILVEVPQSEIAGPVRIHLLGEHDGKPITNDADLEALFTYEPAKK